jgi:S1-C subfamily serine protease
MDDSITGEDRPHLTWRDLPAAPPIGPAPGSPAAPTPDLYAAPVAPAALAQPSSGLRRRTLAIFGAGILAGAVVLGGASLATGGSRPSAPTSQTGRTPHGSPAPVANGGQPSTTPAPQQPGSDPSGSEPIADTAAKLLPSVVQIETSAGLGAGFIADPSGLILTAGHVVGTSSQVTVKLADGSTTPGTVVAVDTSIDTAVVSIQRSDLPALPLANSDQVRVGQIVIAVGSPFGLDQTVTNGIVSALGRSITTEAGPLSNLIQTDAPINPGNSGGPLSDQSGAIIGINTAIASQSGGSNGVGFAVPINEAASLLQSAKNGTAAQPQAGAGNNGQNGTGQNGTGQNGTGQNGLGNGTVPSDPFGLGNGQGNGLGNNDLNNLLGQLFGNGQSTPNGQGGQTDPFGLGGGSSAPNLDQLWQLFNQYLGGQTQPNGTSGSGQ